MRTKQKAKKFNAIRLKSDNFDGLVTVDAYNEITLQMSTGDYHTHTAKKVKVSTLERKDIYTLDDFNMQNFYINEVCPNCGRVR